MASSAAVFDLLDREVWILTARGGGCVVTSAGKASLVPELPRVTVGLAKQHQTWRLIEGSGAFALHLISEEQIDWVWRFGLASGRDTDKLSGMNLCPDSEGSPLLADALGWLDCRVEARLDTGDRTVYLGEVLRGGVTRSGRPLTVQRLMQLAPTERKAELRRLTEADMHNDAAAIRAWRAGRPTGDR